MAHASRSWVGVIGAFVVGGLGVTAAAAEQPGPGAGGAQVSAGFRDMVASARDAVFPALVHVEVFTLSYWGGQEQRSGSTGSGTIISAEGHVLTNAHVVEDGVEFWCTLADKQRVPATLVGEDAATDLAVLKLDLSKVQGGASSLHVATMGDSSTLAVGDLVMAMGSPFGLNRTVTLGIASNVARVFTVGVDGGMDTMFLGGSRTGQFTTWIHHDALINPGNSGGPLVNIRGEVIGVNTRGGEGNSFATPSNIAAFIVAQLLEHGTVPRSEIGAELRHLERTGFERGVFVDAVTSDGAAGKAGLEAGDLIVAIDGKPVTAKFPEQVPPVLYDLAHRKAGEAIALRVERDGKELDLSVMPEPMRPDDGEQEALREWGFSVQEITPFMARLRRLESSEGVLVTGTRSGGPAETAELPLRWGDIIKAVDGKPVPTLESLVAAYEAFGSASQRVDFLVIEFDRDRDRYVTAIDTRDIPLPDPPRELPKSWMGFTTQPVVPELAGHLTEASGAAVEPGFRVTRIYPRTLASSSELRVGDVIVSLNGQPMAPRAAEQGGLLARAIRDLPLESEAKLTVLRSGERVEVALKTERAKTPPEEARRVKNTDFGLVVRAITFFDRDQNRWSEDQQGVVIASVEDGGWASLGGLGEGDLITEIAGTPIAGTKAFEEVMARIEAEQPERVVFVVFRWYRSSFKFVEPRWKPVVGDAKPADGEARGG